MSKISVLLKSSNKALLRCLPGRGFDIHVATTRQIEGNRFSVQGVLTRSEINELRKQHIEVQERGRVQARLHAATEQATTHRCEDMPDGYLTVQQIDASLRSLERQFRFTRRIVLPHKTHEGRASAALVIAKHVRKARPARRRVKKKRKSSARKKPAVMFFAGAHPRETVPPDALVFLARKLCQSYTAGTDLVLGKKTYSAASVKRIVERLDLYFFPLINPDGRNLVMKKGGKRLWRKNLRPNDGGARNLGVDLNRNHDFLWDLGLGGSSLYGNELYKGPAPASEPETNNVLHLIRSASRTLVCSVDMHSFAKVIMYPWCHDENQSEMEALNFREWVFDGFRGKKDDAYREYMPEKDVETFNTLCRAIRDGIQGVRGEVYGIQQGSALYATTGNLTDYPYSRHLRFPGAKKVYSLSIEAAPDEDSNEIPGFQPRFAEAKNIIIDLSAGLLECCLTVLKLRLR
jgi:murein tripeptide amidase MpaA